MAELQSIHRDATSDDLDIQQAVLTLCRAWRLIRFVAIALIIK
jgi:hypothetical protein